MSVGLYCRVSTEEQAASGFSIDQINTGNNGHKANNEEYCNCLVQPDCTNENRQQGDKESPGGDLADLPHMNKV